MMDRPIFKWKRFWYPRGESISLSDHGFLMNPDSEHSRLLHPRLISSESFGKTACLALLGEPGMGKTQALQDYIAMRRSELDPDNYDLIFTNLRSCGDLAHLDKEIFESEKFIRWLRGGHQLEIVLDSLDECLIQSRTTAAYLAEQFNKYPTSRLRLRIACRAAEWPEVLEDELPRIWGSNAYQAFELAPLRRQDAIEAARVLNVDAIRFLDDVDRLDLHSFAIKPITLVMLLQHYRNTGGMLKSQVELYKEYCLHICNEWNPNRRDLRARNIDPERRLAIAERIAGLTLFGKRVAVFTGHNEYEALPEQDLKISEIVGGTERTAGGEAEVTVQSVRDVLTTDLFSGSGNRRAWSHWTYAEYLAARYVVDRGFSLNQIRDLIYSSEAQPDTPSLIPQLKETVSWLAVMRPDVIQDIVRTDPHVLLRSPVATADGSALEMIVSSLLKMAEGAKITDLDLGVKEYRVLRYSGLAEQLRPYIEDDRCQYLSRRMAIDIAEACEQTELVPTFQRLALDHNEDIYVRSQAAHAVVRLGDKEALLGLRPLLDAGDADSDDELKGYALEALWPDHIGASDLFAYLTPPRRTYFYGAYANFISRNVIPHLQVSDLPVALQWVRDLPKQNRGEMSHFAELSATIYKMAWEHMDGPHVLDALTDAIVYRIAEYDPILGDFNRRDNHEKILVADTTRRRKLLAKLVPKINSSGKTKADHLIVSGLLFKDDFEFFIDQALGSSCMNEKKIWTQLARWTFDESMKALEITFSAAERDPVIWGAFNDLWEVVELRSERATTLKKDYETRLRMSKRSQHPTPPPPYQEWADLHLSKFEAGDIDAWWQLNLALTAVSSVKGYHYENIFVSDISAMPGWAALNENTRRAIISSAYSYLEMSNPQAEQWFGQDVLHHPAAAGYRALLLLQKFQPLRLEDLRSETWAKWVPIIVAYPEMQTVDAAPLAQDLVTRANWKAPEEVIRYLGLMIDMENEKDSGHLYSLWKFEKAWDDRLIHVLLQKASEPRTKPEALANILEQILEKPEHGHLAEDAFVLAVAFLIASGKSTDTDRMKAKMCGAILLLFGGEAGWNAIRSILDDEVFGREIIEEAVRRRDSGGRIVQMYSARAVAELYLWLAKAYPHEEDPKVDGAHFVSPRESVAHFRDALFMGLREKGTREAVDAVSQIAEKLGDKWMRYSVSVARSALLRESWRGIPPRILIRMAGDRELRIVGSEVTLVDLVIASLNTYQGLLLGELSPIRHLWNTERDRIRPKGEEEIANAVALHLRKDLADSRIIVNRNVDIRMVDEVDILVEAITDDKRAPWRIIIEVKGCWHPHVETSMEHQLRDRYLRHNECSQGIYLVVWTYCEQWDNNDYRRDVARKNSQTATIEEAREYFENQAKILSLPMAQLRSFILDARYL